MAIIPQMAGVLPLEAAEVNPARPKAAPLIGLVLTSERVFPLLKSSVEKLAHLGVRLRGYHHSGGGEPFQVWLRRLKAEGGLAMWVVLTDTSAPLQQTLAANIAIPVICQYVGADAKARQAELLDQSACAAVLPANRPLEAVKFLAQICALQSPAVTKMMEAENSSAATRERANTAELQRQIDELSKIDASGHKTPPAALKPEQRTSPEDEQLLREVESQMRPKMGQRERATPPAKARVLDYSVPLRRLLTTAREIAGGYSHPEVQAEHLLAAIIDLPETIAHQALLKAGADLENLAGHLIAHFPASHSDVIPGVFALDDSANQVLASAKQAARKRERPCLTSLDFLEALALYASGAATSSLWESGLFAKDILTAIESYGTRVECAELKEEEPARLLTTEELASTERFTDLARRAQRGPQREDESLPWPKEAENTSGGQSEEPPARPRMITTDPNMPGVEEVELASDTLLEGKLLALPLDTMFALAADATNPAAVERLRTVAGLAPEQPISVIIHTMAQLRHVARGISTEISSMLDELWPGPLTIVLKKHPQGFLHLNPEASLALRIPGDFLSLAILSSVGRPLAVTSIDPQEPGGVMGAKQVADRLTGKIHAVVDTRTAPEPVTTTVLSFLEENPRLLRQGAVPAEKLRRFFPDLV